MRLINLGLFLLLGAPILSSAETSGFSVTSGVDYSSGKYGQADSTDITYIPITGKYEQDRFTFKLTVPWLEITGPSAVVGGTDPLLIGKGKTTRSTESGLGDIVAGVTYTAIESPAYKFILDLTAKIKFGTASYNRGLGTGENDYSIIADAYKTFDKFTLMGTLGHRVLGDPNNINLHNVWFTSLGGAYRINKANSFGAFIDLRQRTSDQGSSLREYTAYYAHKFSEQYKLQTYLTHGDTNSSADWGGGVMLGYSW